MNRGHSSGAFASRIASDARSTRSASSNNVAYVWHTSGVKNLDDAKQREVPLAGSGVMSDANIYPAIMNAMLGTKFKVINGYEGTNASNLAVERGEVAGRGGGAYSTLVSTRSRKSARW